MHKSETWTHTFEAESNANSSGVCLVRFGCLAANRPVFLFKQTPSSAVVRGGGISFFFQWGAHIHFCVVILLSILLAAERRTQLLTNSKRSVDKRNPWELHCLLARNRRPFLADTTFSFFPFLSRRAVCFPSAAFFFFCLLLACCCAPANTATFGFSLALRQPWMDVSRMDGCGGYRLVFS